MEGERGKDREGGRKRERERGKESVCVGVGEYVCLCECWREGQLVTVRLRKIVTV